MTDRDLMQQALEALRTLHDENMDYLTRNNLGGENNQCMVFARETITALRERLAQPEMEPCAGRNCGSTNPNLHSAECFEDYEKATGTNQWQGLTDDVVFELADTNLYQGGKNFGVLAFAKAIEQALKEKNHG